MTARALTLLESRKATCLRSLTITGDHSPRPSSTRFNFRHRDHVESIDFLDEYGGMAWLKKLTAGGTQLNRRLLQIPLLHCEGQVCCLSKSGGVGNIDGIGCNRELGRWGGKNEEHGAEDGEDGEDGEANRVVTKIVGEDAGQ